MSKTLTPEQRRDVIWSVDNYAAEYARQELKAEQDKPLTENDAARLAKLRDALIRRVEAIAGSAAEVKP